MSVLDKLKKQYGATTAPAAVKSASISPRGEQSKFKVPTGGTQIGPNKWKTPSGSTWEYKPDGTRIVRLAAQFGGGSYLVNPDKPGEVVREQEKSFGGIPEKSGQQRDHIVPHALGGTSDSRTNIRPVPSAQNEGQFENKIIDQYQSGQKPLGQARLEIMTRKQEQHGNVPKQGVKENLLPAFQEQLPGTGELVQQIKQDPLNVKKATSNPVTATKQVVSAMWNAVKEPVIQEGERLKNYFDTLNTKGNTAARVGAGTQALTGVANIAFSPITALFEGANQMPVLGTVSRAVTIPFSMVGEAGANLAKPVIDQLPISQEAKDQITPGVQEIFALAGQLLLGKAGLETKAWEKLKAKYGERDATTIVNEARKMAFKEQQKQAVAQEKKLVEQAAREVKPAPVADPLIAEARKYKSAEEFVKAQTDPFYEYKDKSLKVFSDEFKGKAEFKEAINDIGGIKNIERGILSPDELNPTEHFDAKNQGVVRAKKEIESGIRTPLVVESGGEGMFAGNFDILDGNHRFAAYRELGIKDIPVITTKGSLPNFKTKSQLTDIWNKAQASVSKPKTIENKTRNVVKEIKSEPIVTPEIKTSKLAKGVELKAVEAGLTRGFADKPEYAKVNMKQQAEAAVRLLDQNPKRAYEVAMGRQLPPEGILPESVFTALENRALKNGDVSTLRDLATSSSLTSEATGMGQRIRALAERNPDSAIGRMQEVVKARKAKAESKLKDKKLDKAVKEEVESVKKEIRKTHTKETWSSFVESLKC